jgi:hypothetical protein
MGAAFGLVSISRHGGRNPAGTAPRQLPDARAFLRTNRIHCQAERRIESVTAYADGVMGDMQEIPENVQSTVNSINREL